MDLNCMLSYGYFPKELPPPFNSKSFAEFISTNQPFKVNSVRKSFHDYWSYPSNHNLARPGNFRRKIMIVNPFNFYNLCLMFSQNWVSIEKHLDKSSISVSRPIPDLSNHRAYRTRISGGDLPLHRAKIRATSRYILKTDISRFYSSIYTHTIPWAMDGKTQAKAQRERGLANAIDRLIRNGQGGQTLGIPVGPDSSLIVAEIIASSIDEELQNCGYNGIRFMDDFEFGFTLRSEAENALAKLEEILGNYELGINPNKTIIEELPITLDKQWVTELRMFSFGKFPDASREELVRYFDIAFRLRSQNLHEPVLNYALARLQSIKISKEQWEIFQNLLFQCAMVEPGTLEWVITYLHLNIHYGISTDFNTVLHRMILRHDTLDHGSEIAWAIWAAIWFKISITETAAKQLSQNKDPVVTLLSFHAKSLGLIDQSIEFNNFESLVREEGCLDTELWLSAYEANIKGWLNKPIGDYVKNHPNFSTLKQQGVSFYDIYVDRPTKYIEVEYSTDEDGFEEDATYF